MNYRKGLFRLYTAFDVAVLIFLVAWALVSEFDDPSLAMLTGIGLLLFPWICHFTGVWIHNGFADNANQTNSAKAILAYKIKRLFQKGTPRYIFIRELFLFCFVTGFLLAVDLEFKYPCLDAIVDIFLNLAWAIFLHRWADMGKRLNRWLFEPLLLVLLLSLPYTIAIDVALILGGQDLAYQLEVGDYTKVLSSAVLIGLILVFGLEVWRWTRGCRKEEGKGELLPGNRNNCLDTPEEHGQEPDYPADTLKTLMLECNPARDKPTPDCDCIADLPRTIHPSDSTIDGDEPTPRTRYGWLSILLIPLAISLAVVLMKNYDYGKIYDSDKSKDVKQDWGENVYGIRCQAGIPIGILDDYKNETIDWQVIDSLEHCSFKLPNNMEPQAAEQRISEKEGFEAAGLALNATDMGFAASQRDPSGFARIHVQQIALPSLGLKTANPQKISRVKLDQLDDALWKLIDRQMSRIGGKIISWDSPICTRVGTAWALSSGYVNTIKDGPSIVSASRIVFTDRRAYKISFGYRLAEAADWETRMNAFLDSFVFDDPHDNYFEIMRPLPGKITSK